MSGTRSIEPEAVGDGDHRRRLLVTMLVAALVLVGIAVPVAVAVVGRTSSASFADTEVLATNHLGAATLDVEVGPETDRPDGDLSSTRMVATNLAPGDAVSGQLELHNAGDVPFWLGLSARADDDGVLATWLRFEAWPGSGACAPGQPGPRLAEDVTLSTTAAVLVETGPPPDGQGIRLGPGERLVVCIGAELPLETPNQAQGQTLGVTFLVTAEQVAEATP